MEGGKQTRLIDIAEMLRIIKIPHNKAYLIRKELLKDLHAENDKLLKELRWSKTLGTTFIDSEKQ